MTATSPVEVRVPDIGDFKDIPIIEVLVKPGDRLSVDDTIATLESEKATLDVPSSVAGTILSVEVEPGHRVSKGSILLVLQPEGMASTPVTALTPVAMPAQEPLRPLNAPEAEPVAPPVRRESTVSRIYASPSVRRIGRELGVDLKALKGSGRGGRILTEDVQQFVRQEMSRSSHEASRSGTSASSGAPPVDFSRFGEVERQPLSRIRKISGTALARNWATIPHVTNFDEADVTELEKFRQVLNAERKDGLKITFLSFLVKAVAATLKTMPQFNASLDGDVLVLKKYVHIGVAVDTSGGLVVPVLKNADKLGLLEIAKSISAVAVSARDGKLKLADMEGGTFTVSSLGGIGGTGFTPIINAPELAILGAGKAAIRPRWDGSAFLPRLILPISLSWDHRALDGVAAAQFLVHFVRLLEDFRRVAL
jgi:pyruvate dehydrogenase E2 component (dihydrolipoamide acetyltransferase)